MHLHSSRNVCQFLIITEKSIILYFLNNCLGYGRQRGRKGRNLSEWEIMKEEKKLITLASKIGFEGAFGSSEGSSFQ